MTPETIRPYRHSGKFTPVGPVAAIAAAAVVSFPLGFAYAYLMKWIPIVYLNVLITVGYGFAFGLLTWWVLKFSKVRNNLVAVLAALIVSLCALYGSWNGHMHALLEEVPLISSPVELWGFLKLLYEVGSWSMRSGDNVTGIMLAIVWGIEAGIIVLLAVGTVYGKTSSMPFCETCQRWLDQERTLDTLAPFTDAAQLAQLKSGDIAPLLDAKPREAGGATFARVTLKYSPQCDTFCTMELENVSVERNTKGEAKETTASVTENLVLPHDMRELVEKFATFESTPASTPPPT